ncbi:MAG: DNRLRE domain-containing protein, partial [Verrucomicrobiota bacterium]
MNKTSAEQIGRGCLRKMARLLVSPVTAWLAASVVATAAPFTAGNLVVERVGDGTGVLSGTATNVFLDEYTSAGSLVQSIALPTTPGTAPATYPLVDSGSATSAGMITRSTDGRFIIIPGYGTNIGFASVVSAAGVARVVGVVKYDGTVDTTTAFSDGFVGNNMRSAASTDGTAIWMVGTSSGAIKGARYTTKGSSTTTSIDPTPNARCVAIFGGNVYYDTATILYKQSGTPTTATTPGTITFSGTAPSSMYQFVIVTVPSGDVCYIADDTLNGILKYSVSGTTFTYQGKITAASVRGLTATVSGSTVILYGATGTTIYTATDTAANNAAPSTASATTLVTAASNKAFRGIVLAPVAPLPAAAGPISGTNSVCANTSGSTYYITNVNNATGYNWTVPAGASVFEGQGTTNITVNWGTTSGAVTVTPTNAAGNGTASSLNVTVMVTPNATMTASSSVCPGLGGTASVPDAGTGATYTWTISGGSISLGDATKAITFTAGASGSVQLTCVVSNTCFNASGSATVPIGPLDSTITAATSICGGSTGNAASVPNAGAGTTYAWSITNGTITAGSGTRLIAYTAGVNGTVDLSCAVTNGSCDSVGMAHVAINPLPDSTITADSTVCGNTNGLVASVPDAGVGASYTWSVVGGVLASGNGSRSITYTAGASGSVSLQCVVTNALGCVSPAGSASVSVTAPPSVTITAPATVAPNSTGNPASVSDAGVGASYAWTIADGAITDGAATRNVTFTAGASGTVVLQCLVTASTGCSATFTTNAVVHKGPFTIYHVNDTHARLTPHYWVIPKHATNDGAFELVGGAAYMGAEVLHLRTNNPNSLFLDAGDISEGNPIGDMTGNGSMVQFYNVLDAKLKAATGRGIDASVVGNHDVRDLSYITNLQNATYPVLSMNICSNGTHNPFFKPYVIVTINGTKIGILGYTTGAAEVGASVAPIIDVVACDWSSTDATKIHVADYVKELRATNGCDVVVLLAHVGQSFICVDSSAAKAIIVDDGTVRVPEIAVTGHWHTWTDTAWQPEILNYKTIFVESASYMKYVGELNVDGAGAYVSAAQHVVRNADITPDADVAALVNNLKTTYDTATALTNGPLLDQVIGYTATPLLLDNIMKWWSPDEYPWSGDNTAGEWICDAMAWKAAIVFNTNCDLAFESGGGVRADVPAGPITYSQIYETFPWNDDLLTLVKMTGQEIYNFVKANNCGAAMSKGWLVIAHDGVPTTITYNGQPINLTNTFNVAINNYMYAHPSSGFSYSDPSPQNSSMLCRQAIVDYTAQFNTTNNMMTVPGPRYQLDTEFSGGYRAVVTMVDDNESNVSYDKAFIRLLNATDETLARRGSKQVPINLVNADGTINQANRLAEAELYRSFLAFKRGQLTNGSIIETWGKNGAYKGNPEFVDQEGIYANGVELKIVGSDTNLAQPTFKNSIAAVFDDSQKNHYVQFNARKTGVSTVTDQFGKTISVYDVTAFTAKTLPGNVGDLLQLSGVPTTESYAMRFRCDNAAVLSSSGGAGFPPISSVLPITPAAQSLAPVTLTAAVTVTAPANTKTLTAVADTQVVRGNPGGNSGGNTGMYVQTANNDTYLDERGWTKFDLSSLTNGNLVAARLRLYCWKAPGAGAPAPITVSPCTDNSWTEFGINWTNQPIFDQTPLDTVTIPNNGTSAYYTWDVTPFIQSRYTNDKLASLVIKADVEGSPVTTTYAFESREWQSAAWGPFLDVDFPSVAVTITNLQFVYRYSADNSSWSAWTPFQTNTAAPWAVTFTYPNGPGYYQFYSVATDSTGAAESAHASADASVQYAPAVWATTPANGTVTNGAVVLSWAAVSDASGYQITVIGTASSNVYYTAGTSLTLPAGLRNGAYSWTVMATNAAGQSAISPTGTFTMVTPVWKFGVLSDTQWTKPDDGKDPNTCAADIVKQVNAQFIAQGVKLVVAVGDTVDVGSWTNIGTRALYAQDLYNAGIGFYPLRGNHEAAELVPDLTSGAELRYAFPQIGSGLNNNTPADITTAILPAGDSNAPAVKSGSPFVVGANFSAPVAVNTANNSVSYSFDYNNMRFVLLDQFDVNGNYYNSTIPAQLPWLSGQLADGTRPPHAMVFTHKNLLGGNHKDNLFDGNLTPTDPGDGFGVDTNAVAATNLALFAQLVAKQQNLDAFIQTLATNNVPYCVSGHDHHHYRSLVQSPVTAGQWVHQLILQSDSSKFYTPLLPVSGNDVPLAQELYKVGYYIVTVDGPKVTVDYYASVGSYPNAFSTTPALTFVKRESFGYSLNGIELVVPQGGSYVTNHSIAAGNGFMGTAMQILNGVNGSTNRVNYGKATAKAVTTAWATNQAGLASDVLTLSGMKDIGAAAGDTYALAVSYDPASVSLAQLQSGQFCLASRTVSSNWVNAVDLNVGGLAPLFVFGPYSSSYPLGAYGVDTNRMTVWAVVNHDGDFAAATVMTTIINVSGNLYQPFSVGLAPGTYVYMEADPTNKSPVRATQRSLGYREVDYKATFFGKLAFSPVSPTVTGTTNLYDYSAQAAKGTYTVGAWKDKNLPIMIGPDGQGYITDGHHTTAGYLSPVNTQTGDVVPGMHRIVLGQIQTNFYSGTPVAVDDAWWAARQAENNAMLFGTNGNQLTIAADAGYAGLQPIMPSVWGMPVTPSTLGSAAMASDQYRALTWGLADGITKAGLNGSTKIKGYLKANPATGKDINFVEFFWADFLRNRVVWDNTKSGHAFGTPTNDANVISAPISFFAAVANGTALARSLDYRDQYGRCLSDYTNSAVFTPNAVNWATASLVNGTAVAGDTYNLFLLDDAGIQGDITPSPLANNILHIDTVAGLMVTNRLANISQVLVNAGAAIATAWKDAVVSNSTVTIPVGTGTVTLKGSNAISGALAVNNGKLAVEGTLAVGSLSVAPSATLEFAYGTDGSPITVNGGVTLNGNLAIRFLGGLPPSGSCRLINYSGTLTGTPGTVSVVSNPSLVATLDTNVPGQINISVKVQPWKFGVLSDTQWTKPDDGK